MSQRLTEESKPLCSKCQACAHRGEPLCCAAPSLTPEAQLFHGTCTMVTIASMASALVAASEVLVAARSISRFVEYVTVGWGRPPERCFSSPRRRFGPTGCTGWPLSSAPPYVMPKCRSAYTVQPWPCSQLDLRYCATCQARPTVHTVKVHTVHLGLGRRVAPIPYRTVYLR